MTQYFFNIGTTLNVATIPYFQLLNTQELPNEEIRILVDTSVARTVILPYSSQFPVRNVKITVVDYTGGAGTNNITVEASGGAPADTINGGSSFVISTNSQSSRFELLNANEWYVLSSGGGGGIVLYGFDVTLPAARVNQLLNDSTLSNLIIPAPSLNQVIEIHTCNFRLENASVVRDGGDPLLYLYGYNPIDSKNFAFSTGTGFLNGVTSDTIVERGASNFAYRLVSDGGGINGAIYIGASTNYAVTKGDGDLRIFGTYSIKQL